MQLSYCELSALLQRIRTPGLCIANLESVFDQDLWVYLRKLPFKNRRRPKARPFLSAQTINKQFKKTIDPD